MSHGPYRADAVTGLTGEAGLCAAKLRQAVEDARGKRTAEVGESAMAKVQHAAILFLLDAEAVFWWIQVMGLDPVVVYPRLLREAGLQEEDTHV